MKVEATVRKFGDSLGIILPDELLQGLKLEEGSPLYLTRGENGELRVDGGEEVDFARFVDDVMERYPEALRELAK